MLRGGVVCSIGVICALVVSLFYANPLVAYALANNEGSHNQSSSSGATSSPSSNNPLEKNLKITTPLTSDLETQVTISFPGKQEILPSDVVFVLDKSGMSAESDINKLAKAFLSDLKTQAQEKGLNIKVGVVNFYYRGAIRQKLTDIITGYSDIESALGSTLGFGSNMHAGLLAAKEMLDNDKEVQPKNKHVVLVSDGAVYLYCKKGENGTWDYTKAYTRSFGDPTKRTKPNSTEKYKYSGDKQGGIWEYQSREYNLANDWKKFKDGSNFTFSNAILDTTRLGEYLDYYRTQENDSTKNWAQYDYAYNFFSRRKGGGQKGIIMPIDVNTPANIDIAYMRTDDVFQEMVRAGYDMKVYYKNTADFDGKVFMQYLARSSNNYQLDTDFTKLKKEILDKIAAGSTLYDEMGARFDFVEDAKKLSLTVGEETLKAESIDKTQHTFGFGKKSDGSYRFVLKYILGSKDVNENITLTLNETIYPSKPLSLTYSEKLVDIPTEPGTYKLPTNKQAVLHPVDGNGKKGQDMSFPSPEVEYSVSHPEPLPTPAPTPTPVPAPEIPAEEPKQPVPTIPEQKKPARMHVIPQTSDIFSVPSFAVVILGGAVSVWGAMRMRTKDTH